MDFDLDMQALPLAILFTIVFAGMIWLVPTWKVIPLWSRITMTLIMPFAFYGVAYFMINR